MQTALAAEHAAVYVYGALGGQTSQAGSPTFYAAIAAAYTEHRARRDLVTRELRDLGATPVAAEPAYALPTGIDTPAGVTRAALALERGCATTYAATVAGTVGPRRRWAIGALTDAAVRELAFGGRPQDLPGS
nr:ferritin-like domain-containing protein [Nocardioides luti]